MTGHLVPGCTLRWPGAFCALGSGCTRWVHHSVPSAPIFVALREQSRGAHWSGSGITSEEAGVAREAAVGPAYQQAGRFLHVPFRLTRGVVFYNHWLTCQQVKLTSAMPGAP